MNLPARSQNLLLAGLAVLAVGASAFSVWSVNRPHPSLDGYEPPSVTVSSSTHEPAGALTSSDDASAEPATAEPATVMPGALSEGVVRWRDAWADEADLLVIGDGYAHLPSQWVQLWATEVGRGRPVAIHHWGEAADVTFNDAVEISGGLGPGLTIWSASRDGTTIEAAAERVDRFVEQAGQPDAVILALGLGSVGEDVDTALDQLAAELDADVPLLLAIGPAGHYDPGVSDALRSWADGHADRVAVVDLRGEAPDLATAEEWAEAFHRSIGG